MGDARWRWFFQWRARTDQPDYLICDYASQRSFDWRQRSILDWIGVQQGKRILDVGCGPGSFAEPLTGDNEVIGVDFVSEMVARARQRGVCPAQGDAAGLPFPSETFDLVLCIGVLQCIEDWRGALQELVRVVVPKGTLVVATLTDSAARRAFYGALTLTGPRRGLRPKLFSIARLSEALRALGTATDVLTLYYPVRHRQMSGGDGLIQNLLSSSFAVRARKLR